MRLGAAKELLGLVLVPASRRTPLLQDAIDRGVLEPLTELGHGRDPGLGHAIQWLWHSRTSSGAGATRYAYNGKTVIDIELQGLPSKWVTLRACMVFKAVDG